MTSLCWPRHRPRQHGRYPGEANTNREREHHYRDKPTYRAKKGYTKRCLVKSLVCRVSLSLNQGALDNYPAQTVCDEDDRSNMTVDSFETE